MEPESLCPMKHQTMMLCKAMLSNQITRSVQSPSGTWSCICWLYTSLLSILQAPGSGLCVIPVQDIRKKRMKSDKYLDLLHSLLFCSARCQITSLTDFPNLHCPDQLFELVNSAGDVCVCVCVHVVMSHNPYRRIHAIYHNVKKKKIYYCFLSIYCFQVKEVIIRKIWVIPGFLGNIAESKHRMVISLFQEILRSQSM